LQTTKTFVLLLNIIFVLQESVVESTDTELD